MTFLTLELQLKWLAGLVALTVGLLMPTFFLVSSYQGKVGELEGESEVVALAVTDFVNRSGGLWRFQREHLEAALRRAAHVEGSIRVVARQGEVVASIGPVVDGFAVRRYREFHEFGQVAGRVETSFPLREVFGQAAGMALLGVGLGLLVFFPLRDLPLRALNETTRALRESEARNRTLVAALTEGVMMVDREGGLLSINDSAREIFGTRLEDWLARRDTVSFLADDQGKALAEADHPLVRAFATGEAQRHRLIRLERGPDDTLWLLVNIQPLKDPDGTVVAVVASVVDISDDRHREEELGRARDVAEAASRAKSQFLANMSHEIRTPLNGVLGMAQLMAMESNLSDKQRRYLDIIRSSGESLLRVIGDILDFSKAEAGRLALAREAFDLRERVDMTLRLMENRAQAKHLELAWRVADAVPRRVTGDAARLHQVLANLVGNAIKFTDRGSVEVEVDLADAGPLEGMWRLEFTVADTGMGIDSAYLPHLFAMFSQADESSTRRHGGTGLGLAISRQLVELMGGEITVDSEPGRGSVFRFTILVGKAEDVAEHGQTASPAPQTLAGRVLVVEDDPTNRTLAKAMLRVMGCDPMLVEGGQQALDWLEAEPCDLVLMDCQMPGLDGFETTRRIRERECAGGVHLPIIALTANALSGDRERCLAAGMDDYLSKPYSREDMAAVLSRWLPARVKKD